MADTEMRLHLKIIHLQDKTMAAIRVIALLIGTTPINQLPAEVQAWLAEPH